MIRGRHRGLPVAIDRAVMLPFEFKKADEMNDEDEGETVDDRDGDRIFEGDASNLHEMNPISESPTSASLRSTPRPSREIPGEP